jgi:hypothetical protein
VQTIEGCFTTGYLPGLTGRGDGEFDFGTYTIYLNQ